MSVRDRVAATAQLAAVVVLSAVALVGLQGAGERPYLHIEWSDLGGWLAVTAPEDAIVAVARVLALGLAWWVLVSTLLYVAARATRLAGALQAVQWATLPAVRRLADRAVAVTLAGSSVLAAAGPAVAADRDRPADMPSAVVVQVDELDDENAGDPTEGYVPIPAGEDPSGVGEVSPSEGSGFRLPMPEAPAPVSPPPATALPPESEHSAEGGEPSGPLATGAEASTGPSEGTAAGEQNSNGEVAPATTSADVRRNDDERDRSASPDAYTVAPGDHLWGIAERALTAAWGRPPSPGELVGYWRQLVAASTGRLASGDPDLIFPGEVIDLPAIPSREE